MSMLVFYSGTMPGHHVIGKRSVRLVPGENKIADYDLAMALISQNIVHAVDDDMAHDVAAKRIKPAVDYGQADDDLTADELDEGAEVGKKITRTKKK